jgi:hypothetical protein
MQNINDIVKNNPKSNAQEVAQAIEVVRQLREIGVPAKGYNLGRPFSGAGHRSRRMARLRVKK